MRRIVGILALSAFLVATAVPASAHPGFEDPYVPAGTQTSLVLGVPSEEPSPMIGVDVALPPDFTLVRLDQTPGWQSTSAAGELHFNGGPAPQGTYVQFTFAGIFAKKEVLSLPVTTRASDGTSRHWQDKASGPFPGAYLFPGYPVGKAPIPTGLSSGSGGTSAVTVAGRILVVAGAVILLGLAVVRRRRREKTPAPPASGSAGRGRPTPSGRDGAAPPGKPHVRRAAKEPTTTPPPG